MTFETEFPTEDFTNYVSGNEPRSTKEIADLAGCSPNTAKAALLMLAKAKKIHMKLIARKCYIWWKNGEAFNDVQDNKGNSARRSNRKDRRV